MAEIFQYLEEFNHVSIVLRLLLSVIFGGIIGAERGMKRQSAGIRTFALVCLGSALAMVTNEFLSIKSIQSGGSADLGRMAAQVISGIGFLGVGTIIVTGRNHVRGLTTAASLWVVATLGIAVGSGFLYGTITGFFFIMVSIKFLQKFSKRQEEYNRILEVYLEISQENGMSYIMEYVKAKEYIIRSMHRKNQKAFSSQDVAVSLELDLKKMTEHDMIINEMQKITGVHYIEEIV